MSQGASEAQAGAPSVPSEQPGAQPYAVLGLSAGANADDVRRAYFGLVRQYGPETHPDEFKRIRAAYDALRSPMRRAALALETFDETAAQVDLDFMASMAHEDAFDAAAMLLAVELSLSDLGRTDFSEDMTAIDEGGLNLQP